jgi:hypothetical protein
MASARKIRDNLFSISWSTRAVANNQPQTVEVKNLTDNLKFCQLRYTMTGVNGILEIEIQFFKAIKPN